jgi:hypothetical protein
MAEDQTQPEKKKTKLSTSWVLTIIAVIALTSLATLIAYHQSQKSDFDELQPQQYQCDRWKIEKDFLTNKQLLSNNVLSDEDIEKFLKLEGLIDKNCQSPTQKNLANLTQLCTPMYITIQKLIDRMENRTLETLEPNDQNLYTHTYNQYFNNNCNNIQDQIVKQRSFLEFNKTRD